MRELTMRTNLAILMQQRQAINRAIKRARNANDQADVETLSTLINLIDSLREALDANANKKLH